MKLKIEGLMKKINSITRLMFFAIFLMVGGQAVAQIKGLNVEKYYIADSNDATDTTGGRSLQVGSVTYRVFVEIEPGSRITKIYGDANHPLEFSSSQNFYNNIDRPSSEFGYEIRSSWFSDNPTLALDSWITLGWAANLEKGVLKSLDPDGDAITGQNNTGGTALIPAGILVNTDTSMGVLLSQADGLTSAIAAATYGQWAEGGFKDLSGNDTTVFGSVQYGNVFSCSSCELRQNLGVIGAGVDSNRVLVAQLTTAGDLNFSINLELQVPDPQNGGFVTIKYVADASVLLPGEQASPYLSYPPVCGCTDPRYLEYSPTFSCSEADSCINLIVFGCMDSAACNFRPDANYNIPSLCCYPGYCNDLDISKVCPQLNYNRFGSASLAIAPNPVTGPITLEILSPEDQDAMLIITDMMGRQVFKRSLYLDEELTVYSMDYAWLPEGVYIMQVQGRRLDSSIRMVRVNP
ncbi:MAG: T9SS type A sorting domain-containing protein [Bacteroidota bacterium]|jgi:hypothetical protein